jgi:hypothetical protein
VLRSDILWLSQPEHAVITCQGTGTLQVPGPHRSAQLWSARATEDSFGQNEDIHCRGWRFVPDAASPASLHVSYPFTCCTCSIDLRFTHNLVSTLGAFDSFPLQHHLSHQYSDTHTTYKATTNGISRGDQSRSPKLSSRSPHEHLPVRTRQAVGIASPFATKHRSHIVSRPLVASNYHDSPEAGAETTCDACESAVAQPK